MKIRIDWYQYRAVVLLAILAFAFFTRMYRLYVPNVYIFDEVYHAVTAKLIARNDPRAFEWWNPPVEEGTAVDWLHPPLAKYTQAFFILMFGENSFGWRFSSVLFGVLVILMTYHLAYRLFDDHRVALLSAFLASLDGLLLVQSRIAMNDIHVTFFILLAFYCYQTYRKEKTALRLVATGLTIGLAMGSKWSGLFALVTIILFEGTYFISHLLQKVQKKESSLENWKKILSFITTRLFWLLLLPFGVYIASYLDMFLQGKSWHHFIELHKQIWWYQTNLKATHPYQSRPLQWFLDLKPVWMYVSYLPNGKRADIYSFGNPALFWLGAGAVVATIGVILHQLYMIFYTTLTAKKSHWLKVTSSLLTRLHTNPIIFLLTAYLIVWLPWQFSPRIMFFYHYTPAVPLLCILLSYWFFRLWQLKKNRVFLRKILVSAVIVIALVFVVWYPHWTGIPVSTTFADTVYFAIPSWK